NVWNHDPNWKVEYFLDGKPMGEMEQQKGYDPLSVTLYKGDKLPLGRTFPEPRMTEHLFIAHFAPTVKKVKVIATDRFGEKFIAES
ncbi:MAG: metallophosphoesterase, partial [Pedobacter sp.]